MFFLYLSYSFLHSFSELNPSLYFYYIFTFGFFNNGKLDKITLLLLFSFPLWLNSARSESPLGFWSWTNRLSKLKKVFDPLRICGSPVFTDLCLCCSYCIVYLHFRALFSKISLQRVRTENKDAWVWNLQNRYTGCPEPFSDPHPLLCELSSVNYLSDAHCLLKELICPDS